MRYLTGFLGCVIGLCTYRGAESAAHPVWMVVFGIFMATVIVPIAFTPYRKGKR